MKNPNIYASRALDRAGHLRRDDAWIQERLADGSSRVLAVWRSRSLVREGDMPISVLLTPAECLPAASQTRVFLGLIDGVAHFAIDVSHHDEPPFRRELPRAPL